MPARVDDCRRRRQEIDSEERARLAELFTSAVSSGMQTLKMDGMEKVLMGLTDLKMVCSVCIK